MEIADYISQYQPLVYRTFSNALKGEKLSHAYLLLGEDGIPLKETALYLAKSILCDNPTPFADLACKTCHRIDNDEYPDFALVDGSEDTIKKEEVANIVSRFSKTALEKKGIMVYIIHEAENMTIEAINGLLKFLEEPSPNTYAILTTRNASKILPTIISRCESIRMLPVPKKKIIQEAISIGVNEDDAELLVRFYNDANLVQEQSETSDYQKAKKAFLSTLEAMQDGELQTRFAIEKDVIPAINSKKSAKMYLDLLSLAFQDIVAIQSGGKGSLPSFKKRFEALIGKIPNAQKALLDTMTLRGKIETNINLGLLFTHLTYELYKKGDTNGK